MKLILVFFVLLIMAVLSGCGRNGEPTAPTQIVAPLDPNVWCSSIISEFKWASPSLPEIELNFDKAGCSLVVNGSKIGTWTQRTIDYLFINITESSDIPSGKCHFDLQTKEILCPGIEEAFVPVQE